MIPVPHVGLAVPSLCLPAIPCPSQIIDAGGGVASSLASQAADSVFQGLGSGLQQAADWLIGHIFEMVVKSTSPQVGANWFGPEMGLMEKVALAVVLPVLMVATIGPVLRQDGRRLARVWGVGLPVSILGGLVASQLAGWLLRATDALCDLVLGGGYQRLGGQFSAAMVSNAVLASPTFVQIILAGLTIAGAVLVWLELMVRSAGVYVATFFMPLALISYIWPATAGLARRAIEVLVSLILSKFVILAALSLGLDALAHGGTDAAVSGAAVLLIAAFAPFALLRLAPVVEASAIAHLEGMSRRPLQAAGRAATAAATAQVHPITQAFMASAGRGAGSEQDGGGLGTRSVASQAIPWRAPGIPDDPEPSGPSREGSDG
ncbi:MAG: hypothetical protein M0Z30_14550 [Actinomycetota bacterium]|nr:hypothetical protein [Actinomycetota bacterium]